jgi:hypothetical protein
MPQLGPVGFEMPIDLSALAPGTYRIELVARDARACAIAAVVEIGA